MKNTFSHHESFHVHHKLIDYNHKTFASIDLGIREIMSEMNITKPRKAKKLRSQLNCVSAEDLTGTGLQSISGEDISCPITFCPLKLGGCALKVI